MARLFVHVEGQTEELFVQEVLAPHLYGRGFHLVAPVFLGNPRQRGGVPSWPSARRDILRKLSGDQGAISTMMVDYYGMPQSGERAWPGRAAASGLRTAEEKAGCVQQALLLDISHALGEPPASCRFVPSVLMHEFEALLFTDGSAVERALCQTGVAAGMRAIREKFQDPEEINDSPGGAPSRRLTGLLAGYQKVFHGNLAALEIGLNVMRSHCRVFDQWVSRLESLAVP